MKIGFIGAGRMGRPMVHRLVAAGHDIAVLVRTPDAHFGSPAERLSCAETVAATVRDAEVVFSVVLTDEQVRAVFLGPDGALGSMRPGSTLVQHTTSNPTTALMLAEAGVAKRIRVLDAAISGGPHDIAEGNLTLWVGGDEGVLEEIRPLLETYASPIMYVGTLGNGQRVKLVNNALFVAQVGLAIDAVRLAGSLGIDEESILAALPHGSGASRGLSVVASGGSVEAVADRLSDLMGKDIAAVREVAGTTGVSLGIIGTVLSSDVVAEKVLGSRNATDHRS
jgi:3-hydroxyisobutyrate dehydrogenase